MKQKAISAVLFGWILILITACSGRAESGTELYTFSLAAKDFVTVVDNPYYPLVPGTKWVYEAKMEDGTTERNEIEVTKETREIMGVAATIVHDVVYVDGQVTEETFDWYAQDKNGNVWYLGEDVSNYANGTLSGHAGSWEWGKDGALPGIIMWAEPAAHLNETYYQEYYEGEAEDQGQVLSVAESVAVPFGAFENVVKTYDFSALEPDLNENKFYASGIGAIKEFDQITGEQVVLTDFTPPTP